METTPISLLERLRRPGQQQAWQRFVQLYTPLLYHWARRLGVRADDAADLVQEVFALLVRKLPEFRYDPDRRFRGWLWTLVVNKLREGKRRATIPLAGDGNGRLAELPTTDPTTLISETEYRRYVANRALQLIRHDFRPTTWKAFWEHVHAGRPAADVARELNLSVGAVYAAKVRVLARLREEFRGLLE